MNDFVTNYTKSTRKELVELVQAQMSEKRFRHVLGVEEMAILLAEKYQVSTTKASIAALVHDYAKERPAADFLAYIEREQLDPDLKQWGNAIWHGVVGAVIIQQELGIKDEEILEAVRIHTTGAAQMSQLAKVLYVADYIEPGRVFPGVEEARRLAFEKLDAAVAYETKQTLAFLVAKEAKIYPKTIETYNKWVAKGN